MDENRPATRALMACLGEPSRFRLVRALIGGPRCVSDLAAEVGLSQSCTTRHLQALERRNVVRGTRDGKRVLYRIRDDRTDLMPLIGWAMEAHAVSGSRSARTPARASRLRETPPASRMADRAPGKRNGVTARAAGPAFGPPAPAQIVSGPAPTAGGPRPAEDDPSSSEPVLAAPIRARRHDTDLEDFLL
jgi:DNA-binding transcriptional ArsR family regulator